MLRNFERIISLKVHFKFRICLADVHAIDMLNYRNMLEDFAICNDNTNMYD